LGELGLYFLGLRGMDFPWISSFSRVVLLALGTLLGFIQPIGRSPTIPFDREKVIPLLTKFKRQIGFGFWGEGLLEEFPWALGGLGGLGFPRKIFSPWGYRGNLDLGSRGIPGPEGNFSLLRGLRLGPVWWFSPWEITSWAG